MTGKAKRGFTEEEIPSSLDTVEGFKGPNGPWKSDDRAQLRHATREAQEWIIRLEPEDVSDYRQMLVNYRFRRSVMKWAKRLFFAATGGFAAMYAAGEKAYRLASAIGRVISDPASVLTVLGELFGK